ncbi:unnamed protein product [Tetraodon nigroviridis]|uniref:BICD family-like cargo adapter 2 n=1 Tax=Tetraodon nigroviridis TaxID=99883 RepID=Q4SFT6_TETNG|nr:unnamed protein product [Tetraodon nigroviridis]
MFTPRKTSLPSPSLEDSFFPLSSTSSASLSFALPPSMSSPGSCDSGGGLDPDLILAAELGQALLEKNEELAASLVQSQRQVEVEFDDLKKAGLMCQALQQEKHVLQRKMDMNELAFGQREAELVTDLAAAKAELERHHSQGRDRRKDECGQLTQLSSHNQRLVEQLAEAVTLEHSLRTELRSLREEMEESSFSRNINFKQLESIQAENRVLLERLAHMEVQLRASEEDSDRLRREREQLRERLSELQSTLREKEAEMEQEQGLVFELRSVNRSLQQKALNMGEDAILDGLQAQPLSLLSEIQHSLESELASVRQEKDSLTQQLLNTIKHKVALSQELDAWQVRPCVGASVEVF